ncbi:MAG: hypothetical protein LBB94_05400 [Clostridiales bacterium]|jgi:hypothetical protein|nr:hypothetical protein [Clostridiales bacterium]
MGKIYTFDDKLLTEKPVIRIKDIDFVIDDRKKTLDLAQERIKERSAGVPEEEVFIRTIFGEEQYKQLESLNLSVSAYIELALYVHAAMFDLTIEEARRRFRGADQQ